MKYRFVILICALLLVKTSRAEDIQDIIQPVKIYYGRSDTILVTDLFYAKSYDLKFAVNDKFIVSYDFERKT